ncbi:MAG TPA: hypothetical protein H9790_02490 [Candidatus Agathobaculum intestinipullorum]|nr:hypothetical protein [Candidatus Agathobaculum intestinipullorum]
MAEFCLDCMNRIDEAHYTRADVKLSFLRELCEGCGEYKRVVTGFRDPHGALLWRLIFRK